MGNGEEIREYIHIYDAAELCCKLIEKIQKYYCKHNWIGTVIKLNVLNLIKR